MQQGTNWNVDAWCLEFDIDLWQHYGVGLCVGSVQLTQILCSVLREVCADCDGLQDQSEVVQQWCQLIPASAMIYRESNQHCFKRDAPKGLLCTQNSFMLYWKSIVGRLAGLTLTRLHFAVVLGAFRFKPFFR